MQSIELQLRRLLLVLAALIAVFTASLATAEQKPIVMLRSLNTALANQVVVAAQDDCAKRGYKVSAAVVGRDGHLLALLRNPLAGPHTAIVSQQKAYTAATFQTSTASMLARTDIQFAPGILVIIGGLPIEIGGHFYGAVAVSGAEPETDEKCAAAGIKAIEDTLEFMD